MLRAWSGGLKTGLYYLRTLHPAFLDHAATGDSGTEPSRTANCPT